MNFIKKSNICQKTTKLGTGKIGYYKGIFATIRTSRVFWKDPTTKINYRGLELDIQMPIEEARTKFKTSYTLGWPVVEHVIVFVDIQDFRTNFVYSEAATLIYAK